MHVSDLPTSASFYGDFAELKSSFKLLNSSKSRSVSFTTCTFQEKELTSFTICNVKNSDVYSSIYGLVLDKNTEGYTPYCAVSVVINNLEHEYPYTISGGFYDESISILTEFDSFLILYFFLQSEVLGSGLKSSNSLSKESPVAVEVWSKLASYESYRGVSCRYNSLDKDSKGRWIIKEGQPIPCEVPYLAKRCRDSTFFISKNSVIPDSVGISSINTNACLALPRVLRGKKL